VLFEGRLLKPTPESVIGVPPVACPKRGQADVNVAEGTYVSHAPQPQSDPPLLDTHTGNFPGGEGGGRKSSVLGDNHSRGVNDGKSPTLMSVEFWVCAYEGKSWGKNPWPSSTRFDVDVDRVTGGSTDVKSTGG